MQLVAALFSFVTRYSVSSVLFDIILPDGECVVLFGPLTLADEVTSVLVIVRSQ